MTRKETSKGYFYTKIEHFDFEKFYTKKMRFSLHFLMWSVFGILLMITYQLAYHLTFFEALMMTVRMTSVNMSVFYIFFYLIYIPVIKLYILWIFMAFCDLFFF